MFKNIISIIGKSKSKLFSLFLYTTSSIITTQTTQARIAPEFNFIPKANFYAFSQLPLEGKPSSLYNYNLLGFYTKYSLEGIFEIGYHYKARLINQWTINAVKAMFNTGVGNEFKQEEKKLEGDLENITGYSVAPKEFHDYHVFMIQVGNLIRIVAGTFAPVHLPEQVFADVYNYGTHYTYHPFDMSREQEVPLRAFIVTFFLDNVIVDSISLRYTGPNAMQAVENLEQEVKQEGEAEEKEATASNPFTKFIYKEEGSFDDKKSFNTRFTLIFNNIFDNRLGTLKNKLILATEYERIGYKLSLIMDEAHFLDEFTFKISLAQTYIILRRNEWNFFISVSSIKEEQPASTDKLAKDWEHLSGGRTIMGQLYYKKPISDTHSLYIGLSISFNVKSEIFSTKFEESKPSIHFNIGFGETTDELSSELIM